MSPGTPHLLMLPEVIPGNSNVWRGGACGGYFLQYNLRAKMRGPPALKRILLSGRRTQESELSKPKISGLSTEAISLPVVLNTGVAARALFQTHSDAM